MTQKKDTTKKAKAKYKLIIFNESTLQELLAMRISRLNVITVIGLIVIISFAIMAALIFFTPIKQLLPGYGDFSARVMAIESAERVDSLQRELELSSRQLATIKAVLTGDIHADSIPTADSLRIAVRDEQIMERSKSEEAFVAQYEENNIYNINSDIKGGGNSNVKLLIAPVRGSVIEGFAPDSARFGIRLSAQPNCPILAIDNGTIIMCDYNQTTGYKLIIQHDDGLISVYKELGTPLRSVGDRLKKGEPIAFNGWNKQNLQEAESNSILLLELWQDGAPINPTDKIIF